MVTACSFLFRRSILEETHLFDSDFFMYVEETDFNMRVRNLGYRIVYNPQSKLNHFVSRSVAQLKVNSIIFKQFHGSINRAKAIGLYFSFADIIKNIHLIIPSFLYWNLFFFTHGEWWLSFKMLYLNWAYFFRGIKQKSKINRNRKWVKWMKPMSLMDILRFKKDIEEKSLAVNNCCP